MIDCRYKHYCRGYPEKCHRCKHSKKKDYFEPDISFIRWGRTTTGGTDLQ